MRRDAQVIVIGAGASGMMAAAWAAMAGRRVIVLEHKEKAGKKLYATGNGKCNFTNENMDPKLFHGNRTLAASVLGRFGKEETLDFFHQIGILPMSRNGYFYPNSQTAASVVRALEQMLARLEVSVCTGVKIESVSSRKRGKIRFAVQTDSGEYRGEKLIVATGLLAYPGLGSDGSALDLVRSFGHGFTPVVPALCGLCAEGLHFGESAGVRTDGRIRLLVDGVCVAEDEGELQLTEYGLSGIPVFQVSRHASLALRDKRKVTAEIDFLPRLSKEETVRELMLRLDSRLLSVRTAGDREQAKGMPDRLSDNTRGSAADRERVGDRLNGLLHHKLVSVLLARAGIGEEQPATKIPTKKIHSLAALMKRCEVTVVSSRGFDHAQVCAGGIRDGEVDPETLESRLVEGLYFCGEILNVDGPCGGYNLQWAWSSGVTAGRNAAGIQTAKIRNGLPVNAVRHCK